MALEIHERHGRAQVGQAGAGRYTALVCALAAYHASATTAAQKLKNMAAELTFKVDKTQIKKQCVGSGVMAGGAGLASVAGIAGLFAASPLIPAALVVGGVMSASGLAVSFGAGREAEARRKRLLAEVEHLFQDLEQKLVKIQGEIQSLVGGSWGNNVVELDQLLVQLCEDMTDPVTRLVDGGQIPRLADLLEILNNLGAAISEIPEEWKLNADNLLCLWHALGQQVPAGLSMMASGQAASCLPATAAANVATKEERCSHGYFAACDKGKPRHFQCYSTGGKVLYVAGLAVNVASTVWSVMEVQSLTNKLKELDAIETAGEKEESSDKGSIYRGVAAYLYNKGEDLEVKLRILFQDLQL
jgi:hypothetical protein